MNVILNNNVVTITLHVLCMLVNKCIK